MPNGCVGHAGVDRAGEMSKAAGNALANPPDPSTIKKGERESLRLIAGAIDPDPERYV